MKKLKKLLAWMLMFVLAVGVIKITSVDVKAADPGEIKFDINDGGTVEYSVNGSDWNSVTDLATINPGSASEIYLRATPAQGKKIDDYPGQQLIHYDQQDDNIDLDGLKNGSYHFSYNPAKEYKVKIRFDNDGGGGGSNVTPGKYIVDISISDAIKNSFSPEIKIEFTDDSGIIKETINTTGSVGEIDIPEGTTKAVITMNGNKLSNARLTPNTSNPSDEVDLIDDIRHKGVKTCDIDTSKGYTFRFEFSNEMNVSWSYDSTNAAPDQLVEHARIELLNSDNPTDFKEEGRTDWNLTIGQEYYFVLIPDYGYQIVGLNINGYSVEPQNSVGVFKFTMQASNFHFQGIVQHEEDIIDYSGEILGEARLSNGSNATANGNVKLSVSDSEQDWDAFSVLGDGYSMFGTVDMTIDQVISKGNGDYWKTPISETSAPVEVSIVVPAGELLEGETYSVVREHEGVYEEINATYDAEAELLSFDTDKFSKYTIVKAPAGNSNPPTPPMPPTPDVPSNETLKMNSELSNKITAAAQTGESTVIYFDEFTGNDCLSNDTLQLLAEKDDVTLVLDYTFYDTNTNQEIHVHAVINQAILSKIYSPDIKYYGPACLSGFVQYYNELPEDIKSQNY